jgi:hypothetical protein
LSILIDSQFTFDYEETVSSALKALEAKLGKKVFGPATLDEAGIALDAGAVDRGIGGSSRSGRSRDKGKQKAASVSALFWILSQDLLTSCLGYVGQGLLKLQETVRHMPTGAG